MGNTPDTNLNWLNENVDAVLAAIIDRLLQHRTDRNAEHPQNEFDFARWDT